MMKTRKTSNPNHNGKLSRLPQDIINTIFAKFSVKDILRLRSVCKSWLSLISSPCFVKNHEIIMYNIFLRLRAKTLSILKSVCKSWLSVISSHDFIKTHLSISTNDPHFTRHGLVLADCRYDGPHDVPWLDLWTCSLYSLLHEPFTQTLRYKDLKIDSIVGYCNGLVLLNDWWLKNKNHLFLCNLSTRQLRKLPKLEYRISFSPSTKYGFCYNESNDDLNVFAISPAAHPSYNEFDKSRTHYEYKVFVYSTKCDYWRMIGDFPFRLVCYNRSTPGFDDGNFANRSIYWSVSPRLQKKIIVSLDIKTETWQEVLQPNFGDGVYNWTLGTFGKSLSVLCHFENTRADLWIMKECGVEMSWTKLFAIPYMHQLVTRDSYLKPICISTNGDIMLNLKNDVVLYNIKENTFKDLLGGYKDLKVYPYAESLVSPNL